MRDGVTQHSKFLHDFSALLPAFRPDSLRRNHPEILHCARISECVPFPRAQCRSAARDKPLSAYCRRFHRRSMAALSAGLGHIVHRAREQATSFRKRINKPVEKDVDAPAGERLRVMGYLVGERRSSGVTLMKVSHLYTLRHYILHSYCSLHCSTGLARAHQLSSSLRRPASCSRPILANEGISANSRMQW